MMDTNEKSPASWGEAFRRLRAVVLAIFHNRLELLVVELQEERNRLFQAVLLVALIVACGFFTLMLAVAAVIILTWNIFGVAGLLVMCGLFLAGTLVLCWRLVIRLKNWPLLPGTLAELKKDRECLDNK
jgi:uncharacterized membrane protein YqjE